VPQEENVPCRNKNSTLYNKEQTNNLRRGMPHNLISVGVCITQQVISNCTEVFIKHDRISTVIGCPGVMTILRNELAMTGPPAEVLGPSLLAGFVVRNTVLKYFSLGSPTASCCCCELAATAFYETSRILTIKGTT
jgi:hypothetical protein